MGLEEFKALTTRLASVQTISMAIKKAVMHDKLITCMGNDHPI